MTVQALHDESNLKDDDQLQQEAIRKPSFAVEPSSLSNDDQDAANESESAGAKPLNHTNGSEAIPTGSTGHERRRTEQTDLTAMLEAEDLRDAGCGYRLLRKCPRMYKALLRWPRSSAIILGVVFPMFFLIMLSTLFGSILAVIEAPLEGQQNDNALAQSTTELSVIQAVINITSLIPELCLAMFLRGTEIGALRENIKLYLLVGPNATSSYLIGELLDPGVNITVNSREILLFMDECGEAAAPLVETMFRNSSSAFKDGSFDNLSFNWIRCYPGANGLGGGGSSPSSIDEFRYNSQYAWYTKLWRESQKEYYDAFLEQNLDANMSRTQAKARALSASIQQATGIDGCMLNAPASGWWWFTMLATVGYGNYVPETSSGRTMVVTLGFLSILAFAGILAVSGVIAAAIFDDCLVRLRLKAVTHPVVAMCVWGALYYSWMAAIMAVTTSYMQSRVGDTTFTNADGYWFAYISSTTVGFGDIYLPPEVFLYRDLIVFPLMWLLSFVLVAAFIAKFADAWVTFRGKRSYVADVLERLHKTEMLLDAPAAREAVANFCKQRINFCCQSRGESDRTKEQPFQTGEAPELRR